jgi:hypothetical protein
VASQQSAEAATKAAKASIQQAELAQETLRLLKESYDEKIGQGPQIVREAIQRAKALIVYWKVEAIHIAQPPHGNPDPAPLTNSGLLNVLNHARQISPKCATLLINADAALVNAKSELEKAYAASMKQTYFPNSGKASAYLEQADALLNHATAELGDLIE